MKRPAAKKVIALQVDPALADTIDQMAKRQHRTRSDFIRQAVLKTLETEHGICAA